MVIFLALLSATITLRIREETKMKQLIFVIAATLAVIIPDSRNYATAAEKLSTMNVEATILGTPLLADIKAAIPSQAVVDKHSLKKKLVVKRKKSNKVASTTKVEQRVDSPGEKLTVSQVLATLKNQQKSLREKHERTSAGRNGFEQK